MTRERFGENNLVDIGGFDIAFREQLALDKFVHCSLSESYIQMTKLNLG